MWRRLGYTLQSFSSGWSRLECKLPHIRRQVNNSPQYCRCLDVRCYNTNNGTLDVFDNLDILKTEYDAVVIGAGHNGLVAASYLQQSGLDVCVLERRHVIGGAAVTEEIIPGFKFSRASYLLSLLRPKIVEELELKKFGLCWFLRDPASYTPLLTPGGITGRATSLTLGRDEKENYKQIAQFSEHDAQNYSVYEDSLNVMVAAIDELIDSAPFSLVNKQEIHWTRRTKNIKRLWTAGKAVSQMGKELPAFYDLLTAPASKILEKWFESEPLKATLATDSVIGAMISPKSPGSGYVLLHHVMGELDGNKGVWAYVQGGMGAVSDAIARSARSKGASVFVNCPIKQILTVDGEAKGVILEDGRHIKSNIVLSNATPNVTFVDLLEKDSLPADYLSDIVNIDYTSPVTKINVAVSRLPNFLADPNTTPTPGPQHRGTIHLNSEHSELIHEAYLQAQQGHASSRPVIEMTIPSSVDNTVSPPGAHVVQLFTQYTPYTLATGELWTEERKEKYANLVFNCIEEYAPGFKSSIVGTDILTPPDLESIFGLTGGNIFHGAISLDQLYFMRPTSKSCNYETPIRGLYICGSGTHPGGGVLGSPGKLAAETVIQSLGRYRRS